MWHPNSILDPLGKRSECISIKFPFINSLKILECATNQVVLLLATLQYLMLTNCATKEILVKSARVQKVLPISTYCGGCARLSRFFRSSIVVGLVLLRTKRTLAMPSYSSYYSRASSSTWRATAKGNSASGTGGCRCHCVHQIRRGPPGAAQWFQIAKTHQKLDWKIREIDWLYLCLQQFDEFWICSTWYGLKRKSCESAETCF